MSTMISVYYDYTCPYSYRVLLWLQKVRAAGRNLDLTWKTFSLKEVNRPPDSRSIFEQPAGDSISVLALELAKAAQLAGSQVFEQYHATIFQRMQGLHQKLTAQDVQQVAQEAGVDLAVFQEERRRGAWLERVAHDHQEGVKRWQVFGTPTLVFDDEVAVYLKFTEVPPPSDAAELFDALICLAKCHPELIEIKYPQSS